MEEADFLHEQAIQAYQTGAPEQAVAWLRQAAALAPDNPHLHTNLGIALIALSDHHQAIDSLTRALALDPNIGMAHYQKALALHALHEPEAALAAVDAALRLSPDEPSALNLRGNLHFQQGQVEQAMANYRQAIAIAPEHALAHFNLGSAWQSLERFDAALDAFDAALALAPDFVEAMSNKGSVLRDMGRVQEALVCHEAARSLAPDHAVVLWNLSLTLLELGQYARAWPLYEHRWHDEPWREIPPGRRWLGDEPLHGCTLFVFGEQGLGDRIQFYRYLHLLAERGAQLLVQAPAALAPLLRRLPGVLRVVDADEPMPEAADFHCALLSLPLAFGTELHTIPLRERAYLQADAAKVAEWSQRLGAAQRPRVGLVMHGNPNNPRDARRSIPLSDWIAHLPRDIDYVLLHEQLRPDDATLLRQAPWIRTVHEDIHDFDDTAALCLLMDCVVSVDTSVAHLSAALGRPTWIALPHAPDWRWHGADAHSPWYGSARLFRQLRRGDWSATLQAIGSALAGLR